MTSSSSSSTIQQLHERFEELPLSLRTNERDFTLSQNELNNESPDLFAMGLDPRITAVNGNAQKSFMRKLKFQYLEQNAKDRFVRSIVSDIDDAPIVTPEDNKELDEVNKGKKGALEVEKGKMMEMYGNIRTLGPLVEQDYIRVGESIKKGQELSQKIIDAQLALTRLRQTHPHPRYTVVSAVAKLDEQVQEMQRLDDTLEQARMKVAEVKMKVGKGNVEVERLRSEKASLKDELQMREEGQDVDKVDDERLAPLYDWFTAAISVHYWIHNLLDSYAVSENELRLTYNVGPPGGEEVKLVINLVFIPETRQLASVQPVGLRELGVSMDPTIDTFVEGNDAPGAVAAILAAARAAMDEVH